MKYYYLVVVVFIVIILFNFCNNSDSNYQKNINANDTSSNTYNIDTVAILEKIKTKDKLFLDFWFGMSRLEYNYVFEKLVYKNDIETYKEEFISNDIISRGKPGVIIKYLYPLYLGNNKIFCSIVPTFLKDSLISLRLNVTPTKLLTYIESQILTIEEYEEYNNLHFKKKNKYMIEHSLKIRDKLIRLYKSKYNTPKYYVKDNFIDSCYWKTNSNKSIIMSFSRVREQERFVKEYGLPEYKEYVWRASIQYYPSKIYDNIQRNIKSTLPSKEDNKKTIKAI